MRLVQNAWVRKWVGEFKMSQYLIERKVPFKERND